MATGEWAGRWIQRRAAKTAAVSHRTMACIVECGPSCTFQQVIPCDALHWLSSPPTLQCSKNKPEEAEEAPALPAVPAKRRKGAQRG